MTRSELLALSCSILFSLMFLCLFVLFYEPAPVKVVACSPSSTPAPPSTAQVVRTQEPKDPNESFRVVPENFAHVNFYNFQYGRYRFGGAKLDLVLTAGQQVVAHEDWGETFSVLDVLYTDVTGDGEPEALVNLSHVQCGVSCDGGSHLLFIYQSTTKGLKKIWEYETGSMSDGCGLKSLTALKKMIVLEMFGHCWQPASSFPGSGRFMVRDVTQSAFVFNGKRFIHQRMGITASPAQDVRNYTPTIHIEP